MGRVRSAINTRMEETSFRVGATASAGVLAVTGGAIALAVALGGNHANAASAPAAVPHTAPLVPVSITPSVAPSPSPTPVKPKPEPKVTSPAAPEEAVVYSAPPSAPSPHRWGGYRERHRMPHGGGWWFPGGHYPGGHGGPHFP